MMRPRARKILLSVHLTVATGWIGAVVAYLALGLSAVKGREVEQVRAAWLSMELVGWYVIVPLAITSWLSGVALALGTKWGLLRHYWVAISLVLTTFSTVVLVLHMPSVSFSADVAQRSQGEALKALGGDLLHPAAGLSVLLVIQVLNVFKPPGLTPYGWRKQQQTPTENSE